MDTTRNVRRLGSARRLCKRGRRMVYLDKHCHLDSNIPTEKERRIMFKYIRFYLEPKREELNKLIIASSKSYFKDKPFVDLTERLTYSRVYGNTYRHEYAMSKINQLKGA